MIKQCILLLAISGLVYTGADAQTWRIARASHSGSADEARSGDDNFGINPNMQRRMDSAYAAKHPDTTKKPVQQTPRKTRRRPAHSHATNR